MTDLEPASVPVVSGRLLDGKVAVVTGGASGIGRAVALAFAAHGARAVVIADVRETPREGGQTTMELISTGTSTAVAFRRCDVRLSGELDAAVEDAESFGGIDVMANIAGITQTVPFLELEAHDMGTILNVNVIGVANGCQLALRRMLPRQRGSIINMSSVVAHVASQNPMYSGSKAAVRMISQSLAALYGSRGIRVNCVYPGFIASAMTNIDHPVLGTPAEDARNQAVPLRRTGLPSDVASAAVFLASDLASFVTGTGVVVDGGWSCQLAAAAATGVTNDHA